MSMVLDSTRTQAFAEHTFGMVNSGFLSMMLSVGHRTGLFDTLAGLPPSTSGQGGVSYLGVRTVPRADGRKQPHDARSDAPGPHPAAGPRAGSATGDRD